jgi:anti-sigma factor RsiW
MRLPRFLRRRQDFPCAHFVEVVTEYLDGAMPHEERTRLEAHLRECDGCTRYLEQIRKTIELGGRLTESDVVAMDPAARESLLAAFRDSRAGPG